MKEQWRNGRISDLVQSGYDAVLQRIICTDGVINV